MAQENHACDPRGLIREAYRIEGITAQECRVIFFDWAVGQAEGDTGAVLARLIARHGAAQPDHPMTKVLEEGMQAISAPRRRRGWRGRRPD